MSSTVDFETGLPIQARHSMWAAPVHQVVNIALGPLMTKTKLSRTEPEAHDAFLTIVAMVTESLETDTKLAHALDRLSEWAQPQLSGNCSNVLYGQKRPHTRTHADACQAVVYARANWSIRNARVSVEQYLTSIDDLLRDSTAAVATLRQAVEATDEDFLPHLAVEAEQRSRENPSVARAMNVAAERLTALAESPESDRQAELAFPIALAILLWEGITSRGGARWKG
jgi:DNA-binding phage protein